MPRKRSFRASSGFKAVSYAITETLEKRQLMSTAVSTFHGDAGSTGQNLTETTLSPNNVNVNTFGKLFSASVDGQVYAQPLYQPGVNITTGASQGLHNVAYVVTEGDSLYAFDAASGLQLWKDNFLIANPALGAGVTVTTMPNSDVGSSDINPQIGITSTPLIDSGFLYLTAKTKQVVASTNHAVYTLYRVNIASGAFTSTIIGDTTYNGTTTYGYNSGPYVLDPHGSGAGQTAATITATNASGGSVTVNHIVSFNTLRQMNRSGITGYNGNIYIAFASHGDTTPYHGWILGFSESSLAPVAVFNADPDGGYDGIWQGGGKIAIDSSGFMYVETGNGTFDTPDASGFPQYGDYGDSFIKIAIDPRTTGPNQTANINGWGLKVVDYFTPQNQAALSSSDQDMGSGAPIVIPTTIGSITLGSATAPNLLAGSGKNGVIYLLNRDNLGKFTATDSGVVQEFSGGVGGGGSYDTPALFYNGSNVSLIYSGKATYAREFTIANGVINTTPLVTPSSYSSFGASPMVSASGTNNGVVWLIDSGTNALRAYRADNMSTELYNSSQNSARDALGAAAKFTSAAVADGQVFVGTSNALVVYGLVAPPTSVPTAPTSLNATVISQAQINLAWTDTASNAFGYYVEQSADGGTSWTQIATTGSSATGYNVPGLQPSSTYTFRVRAFNSLGNSPYSNTISASTTATATPPNFNASGFTGATSTMSLNGNAVLSGTALQLTTSTASQTSSAFTKSAFSIQGFNTTFTFQDTSASGDGMTFTLQGQSPTALGQGGGDLGYGNTGGAGITNSVAIKFDLYNNSGEGSDSTGLFVNGDSPEVPSGAIRQEATLDMTGTISLNSGHVMTVNLAYNGVTLSESITDQTTLAVFTHNYSINIPSFIGGGYAYLGFTGATGGATAIQKVQTWTYTVVPVAPYTPATLTVTPASGTELDLAWSEPYSTVTNFNILKLVNGSYQQIGQVPGTTTVFNATGLNVGAPYSFEVVAVNTIGSSAPTTAVSGTTPTPPLAISNLQFNSLTNSSVKITWTNNATNATGIVIVRQQESNNSQYLITLANTATEYDDSGLLSGVGYDYLVTAVNLAGPSNGVDVLVQTIPVAPATPTVSVAGTGITLTWAPYGHAVAAWNVYRGTTSGGESPTPVATNLASPSYTDPNLTPGLTYYYTVTAVDTGGESPASTEVHGAIATPTPLVLTGPVNYLRLDADGALDVYSNAAGTGTPAQYLPSSVTVNGSASPSTLVVDFSAGNPLPASGLTANGVGGGVSVTIVGDSANDSLVVNSASAVFNSIPLNYTNASTIRFDGGLGSDTLTQNAGAPSLAFLNTTLTDALMVNAGTYTFAAPATGAGIVPVLLGNLAIASGAKVKLADGISHADRSVLRLNALSIAGSSGNWLGTIDLGGNDLDLITGGLAIAMDQLKSGYSNGSWIGTGILSSTAALNISRLTTLGAILNSVSGTPLYSSASPLGTFDTLSPAATDVLIKYTYFGDANLDGKVDASDYSNLDNGSLTTGASTWFNGDFNYDGAVNGADYTLTDNAFNSQAAALAAQVQASIASPSAEKPKTPTQAVRSARASNFIISSSPFQTCTPIVFDTLSPDRLLLDKAKLSSIDLLVAG